MGGSYRVETRFFDHSRILLHARMRHHTPVGRIDFVAIDPLKPKGHPVYAVDAIADGRTPERRPRMADIANGAGCIPQHEARSNQTGILGMPRGKRPGRKPQGNRRFRKRRSAKPEGRRFVAERPFENASGRRIGDRGTDKDRTLFVPGFEYRVFNVRRIDGIEENVPVDSGKTPRILIFQITPLRIFPNLERQRILPFLADRREIEGKTGSGILRRTDEEPVHPYRQLCLRRADIQPDQPSSPFLRNGENTA